MTKQREALPQTAPGEIQVRGVSSWRRLLNIGMDCPGRGWKKEDEYIPGSIQGKTGCSP